MSDPQRLIAQAEIRFTGYFPWEPAGVDLQGKSINEVLADLGLNIPDSYGYTEAVLYDYWQIEEW